MTKKKSKKPVLLPSYIRPERYRLMIHPDLESFTFKCDETIYLKVEKATKEIRLHGVDLEILSVSLVQNSKETVPKKISYKPLEDLVIFDFAKPIVKGDVELRVKFTGGINDKMAGFYRSKYVANGENKFLATTQFEATDARRAFLCVDEPKAKAVFDMTFLIPPTHTVISNTYIKDIKEHESGYKLVSFAPTPKMSTYLVAFIIGEFDFLETKSKEGTIVRVFVTPGKKAQAEFALDTAAKMLSYYNDYFGIQYPMPVLDLIAIPDFASGAMENWGAITYRETALLIDPDHSAASAKQRVALVIAHELAHQWFGNLVTMDWWTHLWLNEGFASWIEYLAVHHLFPEWDIWTQFVYSDLNRALELDSLVNTHPVEVLVNHPREIREIFDAISYSKGASIIRMLADYLGEENFRKGLNIYLNKYKYDNAVTEHLWSALAEGSGKPVKKLMEKWTGIPGYPLVSLLRDKKGNLKLKQARFYSSIVENKKKQKKVLWNIPIGYTNNVSDEKKYVLMNKPELALKDKIGDNGWLNINAGQSGVFRVLYDDQTLASLEAPVKDKLLGASDRLGLANDIFALSRAGLMDTAKTLALLMAYKKEDNYTVWRDIATQLDDLDNIFYGEKFYWKFQQYVQSIFTTIVKTVGWVRLPAPERGDGGQDKKPGEGHLDALLRELVLAQAGKYGDKIVIEEGRKRFNRALSEQKHLDPNLRAMIYGLVGKTGDDKDYEKLLKLYREATLQEEKNRLGAALCQFKQVPLIKRTLKFILSEDVRGQDAPLFLAVIASNNGARDFTWKFIKENWKLLCATYADGHLLGRIITETTCDFNTNEMTKDVEKFFKKNRVPGMERIVAQAVERIKSNADWKKASNKSVEKFFN
ncbi:MAG: M1 family metallopeptidase [Candidatus Vogelbacteria bacterium]|nr:M1 family metallopeptidase [Candidatus Vogelbacteria bacterium]